MVSRSIDFDRTCRFDIRPNRSLTWRQIQWFYLFMLVVLLGIAGTFALLGFWPVLPFAGLELLVLGLGLWHCAASGGEREVVDVGEELVSVRKGRGELHTVWEAQRTWVQVRLVHPQLRWYPTRLVIRSHGKQVQLGGFLNETERHQLADELRSVVDAEARLGERPVVGSSFG